MLVIFFWQLAFSVLLSNLSYLAEDRLGWMVDQTSLLFALVGIVAVVVQALLVKPLLDRLGEVHMALVGFVGMIGGFALLAVLASNQVAAYIYAGAVLAAAGNGLLNASINGLLSGAVGASEQGRAQGANQAVEALARVIGPAAGGWAYQSVGQYAPYSFSAIGLIAAFGLMGLSGRRLSGERNQAAQGEGSPAGRGMHH